MLFVSLKTALLPALVVTVLAGSSLHGQMADAALTHLVIGVTAFWAMALYATRFESLPWVAYLVFGVVSWASFSGLALGVDAEAAVYQSVAYAALAVGFVVGLRHDASRLAIFGLILLAAANVPALWGQVLTIPATDFARGLFLDGNSLSAYASLVLFGLVAVHLHKPVPAVILYLSAPLLIALWAAPTSRGAMLGLGLAVALYVLCSHRPRWVKAIPAVVLVAAFLVGALHGVGESAQVQARLAMWTASVQMWLDTSWWHGAGTGTWHLLYPSYRSVADVDSAGSFAHSDYFQQLAEGGLVALGLYLSLLGVAAIWLSQAAGRSLGAAGRMTWYGGRSSAVALFGFTTFMLHGQVNFLVTTPILAVSGGLLLGIATASLPRYPVQRWHKAWVAALCIVMGLLQVWLFATQASKQSAFVPGSGYSLHMPYMREPAVLNGLASGFPFASATAITTLAVQHYVDARSTHGAEATQHAQASFGLLSSLYSGQPWRTNLMTLESSFRIGLLRTGTLSRTTDQLAKIDALTKAAEQQTPNDMISIRARAAALLTTDGCPAAAGYLANREKAMSPRHWKRKINSERLALPCVKGLAP